MSEVRREYDARLVRTSAGGIVRPPLGEALAGAAIIGLAALGAAAAMPFEGTAVLPLVMAVYTLAAGIALTLVRAHHPHDRFGGANHVTLIRLGGAAVFAGIALEPTMLSDGIAWGALAAAIGLLSLDGVDGWFARHEGTGSAFGARFDMEVDALFILVLAVIAHRIGAAGFWVLGLGLIRYAFVVAGWLRPRLAAPLPASFRRKTVCVLQVAVLTAILAPVIEPPVSSLLAAAALASLVWSFAVDVRWLLNRPAR